MQYPKFGKSIGLLALSLVYAGAQAQIRWVPTADGNWSMAANWAGGQPGPGTSALDVFIDYTPFTITGGIGSFNTTLNSTANIRTLFSRANITLATGASLGIANAGSIVQGTFKMDAGTLTSPGITFQGLMDFSGTGSRVLNTSTVTAAGSASLAGVSFFTNGTLNLQGATSVGDGSIRDGIVNVSATGVISKNSGTGSFVFVQFWNGGPNTFNNAGIVESSSGTMSLISNGVHTGTFRATGTGVVNISGGSHTMNTGASIQTGVLLSGASLTVPLGQQLNVTGNPTWTSGSLNGPGTLVGSGTLNTNGGSPTIGGTLTSNTTLRVTGPLFAVNSTFTNNGTIRMETGSSWRDGVINNAGLIEKVNSGDALVAQSWNGGPRAINNSGTVRSVAGNLKMMGDGGHAGLFEGTGGIVTFEAGTHTLLPGHALRNGVEINGSVNMVIPQGGVMNIAQNPIFRAGTVTAVGTGSTIGGAGEFQLAPNSSIQFAGVFTNTGSMNVVNGAHTWVNSRLNNSGQLRIQAGELRDGIFVNTGSIRKQGAGNADLARPWNGGPSSISNNGNLIVENGLLRLLANGDHTGSFNAQAGELRFEGTAHTFRNGSSLAGNSRFVSSSLTVPAGNQISIIAAEMTNSSLAGAGTIAGPGTLTLTNFNSLQSATLTNAGHIKAVSGPIAFVNATITNTGLFELQSAGTLDVRDGILINQGTVRTVSGTGRLGVNFNGGTTRIDNRNLFEAPTGTVLTLESGGTHSGTFKTDGTGRIEFNGGTHTFEQGALLDGLTITRSSVVCNQAVDIFGVSEFHSGNWSGTGRVMGDTWRWTTAGAKNLGGNLKVEANINHDQGPAQLVNSTLTNRGTATIADGLEWRDGIVVNEGTIQKIAGTGTVNLGVSWSGGTRGFTNTGRLSAQSGTMRVHPTLSNFAGTTLTGGTYEATGTARLWLPIGPVSTLAARAIYRGSGTITQNNGTSSILGDDLVVLGGLEYTDGATKSFDDLEIAGDLFIGPGSSITKVVAGSPAVLQTGGLMRIDGQLVNNVARSAGNLAGTGLLQNITSTGGTISPGNPIGTLSAGAATLTNTTLSVKVKNSTAGNFSRLALTGAFQINAGNTLVADAAPNSTVTAGTTVDVVTTPTRTGTFATVPPATDWSVTYGAGFVRLTANRTITGPILIEATIDLNGYAASYTTAPVVAQLKQGGITIETPVITLRPDRTFAIETRRRGSFDLVLSGGTWLTKQIFPTLNLTDAGVTNLNIALKNGDVNGDNEIGPADFSQVAAAFGTFLGDPNYNANADLNKDDEVGPADFAILASNFGEFGD